SRAHNEQRLLVPPCEGDADDAARRRNHSKTRAGFVQYLYAGVDRHIESTVGIDRHPVAARLELREVAAVRELARADHVEGDDARAVRDVQNPVVRAEADAVGAEILAGDRYRAVRVGVEQTAGREERAALAVRGEI